MVHGLLPGLGNLEAPTTAVAVMYRTDLSTAFGNFRYQLVFPTSDFVFLKNESLDSSRRYLDQLGMAAKYRTKVYCRQSLIGGNYGLLSTGTFVPNPDFYRQEYIEIEIFSFVFQSLV